MKKILVVLFVSLLYSCSEQKTETILESNSKYLPNGAEIISVYVSAQDSINEYYGKGTSWMKWKFEGECFLSRNVEMYSAVLTKIECKED
jgi:hypothetical protein